MKRFLSVPMRIGGSIILGLLAIHFCLWMGRMYLPGFAGELCGKIQGISFTPFFMEFFLIAFGFMVVMALNNFRLKKEGEELVYLEVVDDPNAALPSSSRSVVLPELPEKEDEFHVTLAAIEGSIELKDFQQARELTAEALKTNPRHEKLLSLQTKLNQSPS